MKFFHFLYNKVYVKTYLLSFFQENEIFSFKTILFIPLNISI